MTFPFYIFKIKKMIKNINLIVCIDLNNGISKDGKIPWHYSEDLKYFKKITTDSIEGKKNVVIMGKKTRDDIGFDLPGRENVILRSNDNIIDQLIILSNREDIDKIFIIGGEKIYYIFYYQYYKLIDKIYVTKLTMDYNCDKFFPIIDDKFKIIKDTVSKDMIFLIYQRINRDERQYLNLINKILKEGDIKNNRTGIDTFSLFGEQMIFDLEYSFPLLTTKKTAFKSILRELLWFISGSTDSKVLDKQGVKIWNANGSRKFLDSNGFFDRDEGDLGPIYGHQWRHYSAEYIDCNTDYSGIGIDQLQQCIDLIKNDPDNRRIILNSWNPYQLKEMVLPPCHVMCQFYVRKGKYLDCKLYQRSADIGLGVPFNIASYSLLVYIISHLCNLIPGKFIHTFGDVHVYVNHIEQLKIQMDREPFNFPKLKIIGDIKSIDDFKEDNFKLIGYEFYDAIKMDMAL